MNKRNTLIKRLTGIGLLLTAILAPACGQIADKDRIRIAKIGDRHITRGDLFKLIRETPDVARPLIRNRGDLLRFLNQHIDSRIKLPLGRKLAEEGKVHVPRELAREQFFRESGDEEEQLRHAWSMEIPPPGVITPLMKVYGLTPELLQFNKDMIEEGTDAVIARLQGEQAVQYLAMEALREGRITVDEKEVERDYQFMKEQLVTFETIRFLGIRFPSTVTDASGAAAQLRKRMDAGESFDALVEEYAARGKEDQVEYVIQSDIENNPALTRFRGFWSAASGAQAGDVVGPVYLPAYQQVVEMSDGAPRVTDMPEAYLVFKVLEHTPASVLGLEEARPQIVLPLITAKMMHALREEKGVEVYEDKLPDPSHFQGPTAL